MTFSIIGRCERTGQLGVATTTSDIAIGSRVPWVRPRVGAVVTQHRTDPRLGARMLDLMALGATAQESVEGARSSTIHAPWRQLAAIGATGPAYVWTGERADRSGLAEIAAGDHAVAGNILATTTVGPAISAAFAASPDSALSRRLLAALEAGLGAGGEENPLRSAALLVYAENPFPFIDLRVDDHKQPLVELRRLHQLYEPAAHEYLSRALDPDAASGSISA
ncbi:hypothetical protein B1R94_17445 [Mycolicibacterium litorale]|nr:hypothetical protein B1R94_17445 [Mycolicibacterium litorale]